MNNNLTDLTLVVDRSGSMHSIRDDAEGGLNDLIERQKTEPGDAVLTLVQFDTEYEFVHRGVPIGSVPPYQLVPRGGTALLDAVGRAIVETGSRIAAMPEADRPGLVLFVIITDGQENSSVEYTLKRVRSMIEQQQTVYSWKFLFLGADQDAFAEAGAMGIAADGVAGYSKQKTRASHGVVNSVVSRMRKSQQETGTARAEFTEEERREIE